jgi:beta-lactamase class A
MRPPVFLLASLSLAAADYTFVLSGKGGTRVEHESRADTGYLPCSTFKIPNSLIALETGEVTDAAFPLAYDPARDGVQHGPSLDHDLRSAVRYSAAWYFREIARRVGAARLSDWLARLDYGNRAVTPSVDSFWLSGDLRISARQQVEFLRRVRAGDLPVSQQALALVRDLILLEATRDYKWYGKTGSCRVSAAEWILWHVGFVERDGQTTFYALNLSDATYSGGAARRAAMIRGKLSGLIAPEPPAAFDQMKARIEDTLDRSPGAVRLFARNLDTGQSFGLGADERVRTASTIKLPVMRAVFQAVSEGKARWDEPLVMRAADKVPGSGVIRELADNTKLTIRDLVHLMIVVSDNTATNLLLDRFGADFVNDETRKLGLSSTLVLRKVMGGAPAREGAVPEYAKYGLGVTTPREMVALVESLTPEMLAILQRQQFKDAIGRHQPDADVASKSGALDRLRSDAGLVNSVGGRIAISLTVDDLKRTDYSPENAGNILLARLSDLLVEGLAAPVQHLGEPVRTVELKGTMDHVQGIAVDGNRLWVSWVDRKKQTGHVGEFDIASGGLVRSVEVHNGARYHPGGIALDGDSLWVPVAEYRAGSSSLVQRRNRDTLALEGEFAVADHIGCVAAGPAGLYGGNWDAREIYTWTRDGRQTSKRTNPTGTRYQDLKFSDGDLVGSGLRRGEGAVDFLDPEDLRLRRRIRAGKSSRGVVLTHEGMALDASNLYLLPEDRPSRLFVFPRR